MVSNTTFKMFVLAHQLWRLWNQQQHHVLWFFLWGQYVPTVQEPPETAEQDLHTGKLVHTHTHTDIFIRTLSRLCCLSRSSSEQSQANIIVSMMLFQERTWIFYHASDVIPSYSVVQYSTLVQNQICEQSLHGLPWNWDEIWIRELTLAPRWNSHLWFWLKFLNDMTVGRNIHAPLHD